MPNRRRLISTLTLAALMTGSLAATGCMGFSRKGQNRAHLTPGITSVAKTQDEVANNWHYMVNLNMRSIVDDFGRFWLIDRPSRLIASPTPF